MFNGCVYAFLSLMIILEGGISPIVAFYLYLCTFSTLVVYVLVTSTARLIPSHCIHTGISVSVSAKPFHDASPKCKDTFR